MSCALTVGKTDIPGLYVYHPARIIREKGDVIADTTTKRCRNE
jgi:hypothetical protein